MSISSVRSIRYPRWFDRSFDSATMQSCHDVDAVMPMELTDFGLLNVWQCLHDEGAVAQVLCECRRQPVSLSVVSGRLDREQILEIVGHNAVILFETLEAPTC